MKIYRGNTELADVFMKNTSYVQEVVKGEHYVSIEFDVLNPITFKINDYVLYNSNRYYIRYKERVRKEETSLGYSYTISFYHQMYRLQDFPFYLHGKPEFKKYSGKYFGTALEVLKLIVASANIEDPGWTAGECIEDEPMQFDFNDMTCADVLNDVVGKYNTEYWVEGKTVNIGKRVYDSNGLVLSQGEGGGFTELEVTAVDENPPVTVIIPYGSHESLGKDYGEDYLVLPEIELSKNVDKFGRLPRKVAFPDVKPQGVFEITAVVDTFKFKAAGIDFDLSKQKIGEEDIIVTFQSGGLGGYDLVASGWDNATKQITIEQNPDEKDLKVPGDINFAVGDKFILTNLKMPQSYIDAAVIKLREKAQNWLDGKCENRVQLQGKCDNGLFRREKYFIACGQMVGVFSEELDIDREIRVVGVKRYLENEGNSYRYELTLSDFLIGDGMKQITDAIKDVPKQIEDKVKPIEGFTRRTYFDAKELREMLFDPESNYFTEIIQPLAVHTAQLIVGTNSQQFDLIGVKFQPNYNGNANSFRSTAGQLVHFTINNDRTTRTWNLSAYNTSLGASPYYVYAKCDKYGPNGVMLATTEKILLEQDPSYYHFWVGTLQSPATDGGITYRSWQPMYGFTEIVGNNITTGIIKDRNGRSAYNLETGDIYGKITFSSGSTGYNNLADKPDLSGIDKAIKDAETAYNLAGNKKRVFFYTPSPPYEAGDLWVNSTKNGGKDLMVCTTTRLTGGYNANDWGAATNYDNTKVVIDSGVVTAGAVQVTGQAGSVVAGLAGYGQSPNSIRIWAGTYMSNNANANFRVDQEGRVFSKNGFVIEDANKNQNGGFSSEGSGKTPVRLFIGNNYSGKESAYFRVTAGGDVHGQSFSMENGAGLWETLLQMPNDGTVELSASTANRNIALRAMSILKLTTPIMTITDTENTGVAVSHPSAIRINIGRSASPSYARVWMDCAHSAGWGSSFKVESRYLGDSNEMERTVISAGAMLTKPQLEKYNSALGGSGTISGYAVYWDEKSKNFYLNM